MRNQVRDAQRLNPVLTKFNFFRTLSDIGDNGLEESSPFLSKHWTQNQSQPKNLEPLKILTHDLNNEHKLGSRHHFDSGYISPNIPGKAFYDVQPPLEQPRVDPLLLQQVLQQHHHYHHQQPQKHQHLVNHRPITGNLSVFSVLFPNS